MTQNLSYYRLLLLSFLRESHPQLLTDENFISVRAEAALDAYEQAIKNGENHFAAEHSANEILFNALHFSKFETLKNILWNEFSNEFSEEDAPALAMKFLSKCEDIFTKYFLSDEFAYSPDYERLYTELTGEIALIIENRKS